MLLTIIGLKVCRICVVSFCASVRFCSFFVKGLILGTNVPAEFFLLLCVVCVATSCRKHWLGLGVRGVVVG